MAAGGELQDNPVGINVVPMVDVIFCLCVFFMCSFRFKEREGRLEAWLPKDLGNGPSAPGETRELRVALFWDESAGTVTRRFGMRDVGDDLELESLLRGSREDGDRVGAHDVPLIVDSDPRVPWSHVVNLVSIGRHVGVARVQFASGGN